jgi:hypothetical protein
MASSEHKTRIRDIQVQSDISSPLLQPSCQRCGGFMVNDVSIDLMNSTSELDCRTKRCVQCGDILDPVILRNRRIRQESMTVQCARNSLPSNRAMQLR